MSLQPGALLAFIRKQIEDYDYEAAYRAHSDPVGSPFPQSVIDADLDRFRSALVEPFWVEFERRDTYDEVRSPTAVVESALVVTDGRDDYFLAYQPEKMEFVVLKICDYRYQSMGINGDAVGCYLSM